MALKLTSSGNPQSWKVLVTAKLAGVEVSTDGSAQSPLGRTPVLETSEGALFESNAIARYVARQGKNNLYGKSAYEAGLVDQWVDFATNEIDLPASVIVFPLLGLIENNQIAVEKANGDVRKVLEALNKHFVTRTFLVGQRLSLADVVVASSLFHLYQKYLDAAFRKPYSHVTRWFLTVVNQPEFKAVAGEFVLCNVKETPKEVVKVEKPKKRSCTKERGCT